jgi:AcrR family transcriptional regulator
MPTSQSADAILRTVLELLEDGGHDAVHLREVARRAQVSLATIYKLFPTRDELIVAALERWMAANSYARLPPPPPGETLYDGFMRLFRQIVEPWERSPRMLEAYHRAQAGPGGERLRRQAMKSTKPAAEAMLAGRDPRYAEDVLLILAHVGPAVIARFAAHEIGITDILPILERTVHRLTSDNTAAATMAHRERGSAGTASAQL